MNVLKAKLAAANTAALVVKDLNKPTTGGLTPNDMNKLKAVGMFINQMKNSVLAMCDVLAETTMAQQQTTIRTLVGRFRVVPDPMRCLQSLEGICKVYTTQMLSMMDLALNLENPKLPAYMVFDDGSGGDKLKAAMTAPSGPVAGPPGLGLERRKSIMADTEFGKEESEHELALIHSLTKLQGLQDKVRLLSAQLKSSFELMGGYRKDIVDLKADIEDRKHKNYLLSQALADASKGKVKISDATRSDYLRSGMGTDMGCQTEEMDDFGGRTTNSRGGVHSRVSRRSKDATAKTDQDFKYKGSLSPSNSSSNIDSEEIDLVEDGNDPDASDDEAAVTSDGKPQSRQGKGSKAASKDSKPSKAVVRKNASKSKMGKRRPAVRGNSSESESGDEGNASKGGKKGKTGSALSKAKKDKVLKKSMRETDNTRKRQSSTKPTRRSKQEKAGARHKHESSEFSEEEDESSPSRKSKVKEARSRHSTSNMRHTANESDYDSGELHSKARSSSKHHETSSHSKARGEKKGLASTKEDHKAESKPNVKKPEGKAGQLTAAAKKADPKKPGDSGSLASLSKQIEELKTELAKARKENTSLHMGEKTAASLKPSKSESVQKKGAEKDKKAEEKSAAEEECKKCAGKIGNLEQAILRLNQKIVGLEKVMSALRDQVGPSDPVVKMMEHKQQEKAAGSKGGLGSPRAGRVTSNATMQTQKPQTAIWPPGSALVPNGTVGISTAHRQPPAVGQWGPGGVKDIKIQGGAGVSAADPFADLGGFGNIDLSGLSEVKESAKELENLRKETEQQKKDLAYNRSLLKKLLRARWIHATKDVTKRGKDELRLSTIKSKLLSMNTQYKRDKLKWNESYKEVAARNVELAERVRLISGGVASDGVIRYRTIEDLQQSFEVERQRLSNLCTEMEEERDLVVDRMNSWKDKMGKLEKEHAATAKTVSNAKKALTAKTKELTELTSKSSQQINQLNESTTQAQTEALELKSKLTQLEAEHAELVTNFESYKQRSEEAMEKAVNDFKLQVEVATVEQRQLSEALKQQVGELRQALSTELKSHEGLECKPSCVLRFKQLSLLLDGLKQEARDAHIETTCHKRKMVEWKTQHTRLLTSLKDAVQQTHKLPRPEKDQRFWALVSKELTRAEDASLTTLRPRLQAKNADQLAKELNKSEKTRDKTEQQLDSALGRYEKLKRQHAIAVQRLQWQAASANQAPGVLGADVWKTADDVITASNRIDPAVLGSGLALVGLAGSPATQVLRNREAWGDELEAQAFGPKPPTISIDTKRISPNNTRKTNASPNDSRKSNRSQTARDTSPRVYAFRQTGDHLTLVSPTLPVTLLPIV